MKRFNLKENLPLVENFTRKYVVEVLTAVAIVAGAFSSWLDLFWGSWGWSALFLVIGAVVGLFWSKGVDPMIKKMYSFSAGNKVMMIGSECVKILIALFIPFIYFAFVGLMAGTAYQYYLHFMHSESKGKKAA